MVKGGPLPALRILATGLEGGRGQGVLWASFIRALIRPEASTLTVQSLPKGPASHTLPLGEQDLPLHLSVGGGRGAQTFRQGTPL